MIKHGTAYQEAQGDLSNLPSCLGCTVCAHSPGRAWPWVQSVAGAWGRAVLVLPCAPTDCGAQVCHTLLSGPQTHSSHHRHLPSPSPQPQQDRLCRKTPGCAHRKGSGVPVLGLHAKGRTQAHHEAHSQENTAVSVEKGLP